MATFALRRFARPETLKCVNPRHLHQLLSPFGEFFARRGVVLPASPDGATDYEKLTAVLISPASDTPEELAEALFFIHEMSTPQGMDALLEEAPRRHLVIADDSSLADVAIQVWLQDRELLERKHAESCLFRPRTFHNLLADGKRRGYLIDPSERQLLALEKALDDWFESKKRGRGTKVFVFPKEDDVWFLVRHGEPYKREGCMEGPNGASVFYRPERFDVLIYRPSLGELRVNARCKDEIELYRVQFGEHLFDNRAFFIWPGKYTLEPLRTDGRSSLVCSDVRAIESVALVEIQFAVGGKYRDLRIFRGSDLFAARELLPWSVPDSCTIRQATFRIRFADSHRPRSVVIQPPSVAQYTRDGDAALVERWLVARGFCMLEHKHAACA
jgi:hypothetical protein